MWIFVEFVDRPKVSLDVDSSDTIDAVKAKIQDRFGQGRLNVYGRFSFMKQDFAGSDTIANVNLKIIDEEGGLPAFFDSLIVDSCVLTVHIAYLSGETIVVEVSKKDILSISTLTERAVMEKNHKAIACYPAPENTLPSTRKHKTHQQKPFPLALTERVLAFQPPWARFAGSCRRVSR